MDASNLFQTWVINVAIDATLQIVLTGIFIALYPLYMFALYKMAQKHNIKHAWISFIPFLNDYTLVSLAQTINLFGKRYLYVIIIILLQLVILSTVVQYDLGLFQFLHNLMFGYSLATIFFRLSPKNAIGFTILSCCSNFILTPILLFMIRDK